MPILTIIKVENHVVKMDDYNCKLDEVLQAYDKGEYETREKIVSNRYVYYRNNETEKKTPILKIPLTEEDLVSENDDLRFGDWNVWNAIVGEVTAILDTIGESKNAVSFREENQALREDMKNREKPFKELRGIVRKYVYLDMDDSIYNMILDRDKPSHL